MDVKKFTFLFFLFCEVLVSQMYHKPGTTTAQFLRIGPGARAAGMGGAFTSIADDASTLFYNPAGMNLIEKSELILTHINWIAGVRYDFAGLVYKYNSRQSFGISIFTLYTDMMPVRTPLHPEGTGRMFRVYDIAFGLSYARYLTNSFSFGLSLKLIRLDLGSVLNPAFVQYGLAFDIGAIYLTGVRDIRIGAVLGNFGTDIKFVDEEYSLPLSFSLGISGNLINVQKHRLTLAISLMKPSELREFQSVGIEYSFMNIFSLRAGYKLNRTSENWSFGAGVVTEISRLKIYIDYSYSDFSILKNVQRFSVRLSW